MVKEEIFKTECADSCCIKSKFSGLILLGASVIEKTQIKLVSDNPDVIGDFVFLSRKLGIEAIVKQSSKSIKYTAVISDSVKVAQLLYDLDIMDKETGEINYRVSKEVVRKPCCKREFLKGAFLGFGTVSDPMKNYNLEIVTPNCEFCNDLMEMFNELGFEFRKIAREKRFVVYTKNSETISDVLSFFGAYKSQMELINIKIEKEIRNDVNRNVNSETSNLSRTINASVEHIQAIQKIDESIGLDNLPDDLREIALLRLRHKDSSLTELGQMLNPPLTKSGVNHRMKKILKYNE